EGVRRTGEGYRTSDPTSIRLIWSTQLSEFTNCTSLRPAELLFKFVVIHFDQGRPAVRAGVRHRATPKVIHEILQLRATQGVVRLHGVTANCLRDGVFAEA